MFKMDSESEIGTRLYSAGVLYSLQRHDNRIFIYKIRPQFDLRQGEDA